MKQSNRLTEGALFAGIYLVFLIITFFVPVVGFISFFLLPVPYIIYGVRHGLRPSILLFLVTIFLSGLFTSFASIPITVFAGLGGIAIGISIHQNKSPYEAWAGGAAGFAVGFVFIYGVSQWLFQVNWMDEFQSMLETSMDQTKTIIEQFGGAVSMEQLNLLEEQFQQMLYLFPTGIALFGIFFAFVAQWIGFKVLNRIDSNTRLLFPKFKTFTLPTALLWYYFLAMIGMWIFTEQGSLVHQAAVNIYTLTGLLIALQGLSFIFYFAEYKSWSKAVPVIAIFGIFLFPFLFLYPIRILGIIDIGFNLRERLQSDEK